MNKRTKVYAVLSGVVLCTAMGAAAVSANGTTSAAGSADTSEAALHTQLHSLNNSGAFGSADVHVDGRRAHVDIDAYMLLKGMPHAQHIHFGQEARNECPTAFDAGPDFRLSTADGLPAYGPIIKSLTTKGDTSPASALAVDRFPTTPNGSEHYDRRINFSSDAVARAIRNGRGVLVIHGVDYNGNGKYDFAGAGRSELDPSLPAEATDPAICGVLRAK